MSSLRSGEQRKKNGRRFHSAAAPLGGTLGMLLSLTVFSGIAPCGMAQQVVSPQVVIEQAPPQQMLPMTQFRSHQIRPQSARGVFVPVVWQQDNSGAPRPGRQGGPPRRRPLPPLPPALIERLK